jgi:hypothetical protein
VWHEDGLGSSIALVRNNLARLLAIAFLASQAFVFVSAAAAFNVSAQQSAPTDCADHPGGSDSASGSDCPCCPEGATGGECSTTCALSSAIANDWLADADELSSDAEPSPAPLPHTRTDSPLNPPPIR